VHTKPSTTPGPLDRLRPEARGTWSARRVSAAASSARRPGGRRGPTSTSVTRRAAERMSAFRELLRPIEPSIGVTTPAGRR
jgi:hypothetical protein